MKLIYLSLPNSELAIARVKARVAQGGHNVASAIVRRRFITSWYNFQQRYTLRVDAWAHSDNSGARPRLITDGVKA